MEYYTYFYLDPTTNTVRYVGYGHNRRAYSHLKKTHNKTFAGWLRNLKEGRLESKIFKINVPSKDEAKKLEIFWIAYYGRIDKNTGTLFNHTDGGDGGHGMTFKHTEKTKKEHSEFMRGRFVGEKNAFYGRQHKEETKENQSNVMKNRMVGEKNPFYGRQHPKEIQDRITEQNIGRKHSEEAKRKIGEASKTRIRGPRSEETKRKISESLRICSLSRVENK